MNLDRLPDTYSDTSSFSYHVDDEWYDDLDRFRQVLTDDWPAAPITDWHEAQSFLTAEARLIDSGRFNDWLDLFTGDCLYWVPVTAGGGDPRREVSHAFDDHRRLTDRVYWLRTGLAYSQLPPRREPDASSPTSSVWTIPTGSDTSGPTSSSTRCAQAPPRPTPGGTDTCCARPETAGRSGSNRST